MENAESNRLNERRRGNGKDDCIECKQKVTEKHRAIECDMCSKWQHIGCKEIMKEEDYDKMVEESRESEWKCNKCVKKQETEGMKIENTKMKEKNKGKRKDDCLECGKKVTRKQKALECDGCNKRQHTECSDTKTERDQRKIINSDDKWRCSNCRKESIKIKV